MVLSRSKCNVCSLRINSCRDDKIMENFILGFMGGFVLLPLVGVFIGNRENAE